LRHCTGTSRHQSTRSTSRPPSLHSQQERVGLVRSLKLAFHDADTDTDTNILARILADTSDARDVLKLFLRQAERHADILAAILTMMSARMSVSVSWNAGFSVPSGCWYVVVLM